MIGATGIIADGLWGPVAQEDGACIFQSRQQGSRLLGLNDQVLRGVLIGDEACLGQIFTHNRQAGGQGLLGDLGTGELRQLSGQLGVYSIGDDAARGHQHHLRIRAVLGLREQIGGDEGRIGGLIGDNQHLRGAGRHVDGGTAKIHADLAFGLGDPGVTGAEDFVDLADRIGAIGHGGDRLGATHGVDLTDTAEGGGIDDLIGNWRRRAEHHLAATGNLGGNRQHQHGTDQRGAAPWHIETHAADGMGVQLAAHAGLGFEL